MSPDVTVVDVIVAVGGGMLGGAVWLALVVSYGAVRKWARWRKIRRRWQAHWEDRP